MTTSITGCGFTASDLAHPAQHRGLVLRIIGRQVEHDLVRFRPGGLLCPDSSSGDDRKHTQESGGENPAPTYFASTRNARVLSLFERSK
jgi:hypothetical protein